MDVAMSPASRSSTSKVPTIQMLCAKWWSAS